MSECSICLEDITKLYARTQPCAHKFHFECISSWILQKNTCPLCKSRLDQVHTLDLRDDCVGSRKKQFSLVSRRGQTILEEVKVQEETFLAADTLAFPVAHVELRRTRSTVTRAQVADLDVIPDSEDDTNHSPKRKKRRGRPGKKEKLSCDVSEPSSHVSTQPNASSSTRAKKQGKSELETTFGDTTKKCGSVVWIRSRVTGKWVRSRESSLPHPAKLEPSPQRDSKASAMLLPVNNEIKIASPIKSAAGEAEYASMPSKPPKTDHHEVENALGSFERLLADHKQHMTEALGGPRCSPQTSLWNRLLTRASTSDLSSGNSLSLSSPVPAAVCMSEEVALSPPCKYEADKENKADSNHVRNCDISKQARSTFKQKKSKFIADEPATVTTTTVAPNTRLRRRVGIRK